MSNFIEMARDYASSHTKSVTKITHFIGVPIIVFSVMIFFGFVKIIIPHYLSTSLAWLLMVVVLAYYFKLNYRLALAVTPIFCLLNWLADKISSVGPTKGALELFLLLFIFGWIIQFVGHFYEKKQPVFLSNLKHAMIAPLVLIAEVFFYFGMMNELYNELYETDQNDIEQKNRQRVEANQAE